MKKQKLKIEQIKISSYVTSVNDTEGKTVLGGVVAFTHRSCVNGTLNCCPSFGSFCSIVINCKNDAAAGNIQG